MRSLSGSPDPTLRAPRPLALILAGVAAPVWGVAGLARGLTLLVPGVLVLALSAPLSLVLALLVLACRSWDRLALGLAVPARLALGPGILALLVLAPLALAVLEVAEPTAAHQESRACFNKRRPTRVAMSEHKISWGG